MNCLARFGSRMRGAVFALASRNVAPQNPAVVGRSMGTLGWNSWSAAGVTALSRTTYFPSSGIRQIHSKGERELVEFLTEEIVAEKKAQKVKNIPAELDGFKVKLDGAEVTLTKQLGNETITVTFNVNHTVDAEDSEDETVDPTKEEFAEMRSKPQFEVDIVRGDTTLSFTCNFIQEHQPAQEGDGYNDIFGIEEVTMFQGQWNDKIYAVAGDVLDGYLYDLLMNYLEEKGISNDFAQKLSDFSTVYEHSAYICLLESLSKFTIGKP